MAARHSSWIAKTWLSDKSSWPLFAIIGGAAGIVGYSGYRYLFQHPDVFVNRKHRKEGMELDAHHDRSNYFYSHSLRDLKYDSPHLGHQFSDAKAAKASKSNDNKTETKKRAEQAH